MPPLVTNATARAPNHLDQRDGLRRDVINSWVLNRQKSEVGLMKYYACRRHVAAIAPAEISASLSRVRGSSQKIARLRSKSNFGKNLLLYQFGSGIPSTTMASPTVPALGPEGDSLDDLQWRRSEL